MDGVVILSIFDWWYHSHGHSDIQLAHAFAKRFPVLFVNSIGMRAPRRGTATAPLRRIGRKLRSMARPLQFPDPNEKLAVASPIAWPAYSGIAGRINIAAVQVQVRNFLAKLNIQNPIVVVTVPTYAPVALGLPRKALFYNRSDLHSSFPGANERMLRGYEDRLFCHADAILYASEQLFRSEVALVKRAVLVGHGIDNGLFTPEGEVAPEIDHLQRPRVGFFGELRGRSVDFALISAVARLCPSIQFVLGGAQLDDVRELASLANVRILLPCAHADMPARWRGVDAAILPYKQSPWLNASEPVKLNEVLAMGLPAVGTPLPALLRHSGSIEIAQDACSFADAVHRVVAGSRTTGARRAVPNLPTWDSIAARIVDLSRMGGQVECQSG
jgi:glycosyltransferase involved in cell wall biosynthesis